VRWLADKQVCVVGADNFAVDVVPPADPEVFHPCHQHPIMRRGIYLHEGMNLDGVAEREAYVFVYVFAPLRWRDGVAGQSTRDSIIDRDERGRAKAQSVRTSPLKRRWSAS
jgi:kynurenine formamidase